MCSITRKDLGFKVFGKIQYLPLNSTELNSAPGFSLGCQRFSADIGYTAISTARKQVEECLRFLAEIGAALAASLDVSETLQTAIGTALQGRDDPGPSRWTWRLARAWQANRHPAGHTPRALPIWIAPPGQVIPTWRRELAGAFPAADVLVIRDHTDVDRWMARCAESDAPAVIALLSYSTKAATGLRQLPAIKETIEIRRVPALAPAEEQRPYLNPVRERGNGPVVAYRERMHP